jgi:hypothetical protein
MATLRQLPASASHRVAQQPSRPQHAARNLLLSGLASVALMSTPLPAQSLPPPSNDPARCTVEALDKFAGGQLAWPRRRLLGRRRRPGAPPTARDVWRAENVDTLAWLLLGWFWCEV